MVKVRLCCAYNESLWTIFVQLCPRGTVQSTYTLLWLKCIDPHSLCCGAKDVHTLKSGQLKKIHGALRKAPFFSNSEVWPPGTSWRTWRMEGQEVRQANIVWKCMKRIWKGTVKSPKGKQLLFEFRSGWNPQHFSRMTGPVWMMQTTSQVSYANYVDMCVLIILCSAIPKTSQVDIGGFSKFLSEHLDRMMQMNATDWLIFQRSCFSHFFADDMFI